MLYLVRHAKAGSRHDWDGEDQLRPLSKKGWAQAEALARRLRRRTITDLVSSPYIRCVQTLEPLATRLDTVVQTDERLAEDNDFRGALELIESLPDGSVMCSHGDVIPATMQALERRGCAFNGEPDWRKASVWLLEREPGGTVTRARVWAPPGK